MKVYTENSRSLEQTSRMKQAQDKDICPFCQDGLVEIHKQPILKETSNFFVTPNAFPYTGSKHHYLIIPKTHITSPEKFSKDDWSQIGSLFTWTTKEYSIINGGMFMRFGNVHKTGSSVYHLHLQIISGSKSDTDTDATGLKVKLGYK